MASGELYALKYLIVQYVAGAGRMSDGASQS